jgi:cyclohexanone monooxygenase
MMVSIEQHVDFVAGLLAHMQAHRLACVEPAAEAQAQWVEHTRQVADRTLYPRAGSWYMGANIPGKPRVFMPYVGGVGTYRAICDGIAARGYEGLMLAPQRAAAAE